LSRAIEDDADSAPAYYYLAQTILASPEHESLLTEVEEPFGTYMKKGDPLGKEDEVNRFLS
jgi:hypothetical protein